MDNEIRDILIKDKKAMLGEKSKIEILKLAIAHHPLWLRWKYICYLRKADNAKFFLFKYIYKKKKNKYGVKLGIDISSAKNIGYGLVLHHTGIICNSDAIIGNNCHFHGHNCVGNNGKDDKCPILGNNVDIGVGAVIIGDVRIADNVIIGANAVVLKDILDEGSTWVGVPAHDIKK